LYIGITEAAKLAGKSRKTLYKSHHKGLLSFNKSPSGRFTVDVAELIRCYGELPNQKAKETKETKAGLLKETDIIKELKALRDEIKELKCEVKQLRSLSLPAPIDLTEEAEESVNKNHDFKSIIDKMRREQ